MAQDDSFHSSWASNDRWYRKKGEDLGKTVWTLGTSLESDQDWRVSLYHRMLRLYEGRTQEFSRKGNQSRRFDSELNYNLSRAASDTVHAEIAGRQKPTPKLQTSDADWKTKRRAKKIEKFCGAVLHQKQGVHLNAWELMENCFLDCAIGGMGVAKVFSRGGRINIERHFAHELFVDEAEAQYGDPQNLFHVYQMERDKALWAFALDPSLDLSNKRRRDIAKAIETAEEVEVEKYGSAARAAKSIKIVEAWRLPAGEGQPGKHCFCINNALLHEEEWTRPEFPFVFMRWEWDRDGWYATGLVEQGESIHLEVNENATKLQERFRLCGAKRTFIEAGSVNINAMRQNESEVLIEVSKGAQMPKEAPPKPIAESEMAWFESLFQKYFEISGVSQMRASSRKEPGVTAGIAIRTLNDMQTARFALKAKSYENAFVSLAHQIIYCAREADEAGEDTIARYDDEIRWSEVKLPEDTFDITIAPTSSLPNDPAGRMQMTQELYSSGVVGIETYKQLLGWPDLEKEMNFQSAQTRWLEKLIDRILDEGEEAYEAPDGHIMDKPRALMQTSQAYFDALYDDAPEENLALLREYMMGLDKLIADGEKAAAMAQAELQMEIQGAMTPAPGMEPEAAAAGPAQANRPPVAEGGPIAAE